MGNIPERTFPSSVVAAAAALLVLPLPAAVEAQDGCCTPIPVDPVAYRVDALVQRHFSHAEFWRAVEDHLADRAVRVEEVGRSLHGRSIGAVHFGVGPTRVLLWSQMHGNESTATMALADIIRFLTEARGDAVRERIRDRLTVTMVPMLNPDGAESFQRYNAVGVDVNRDARRLATPEGRALKELRDRLQPEFGFNLHDQGARTTVGRGGDRVAIALLAPAADQGRSYGPVRSRARLVAAAVAAALDERIPGRVAKYDDTFNPRAFGDLMQAWGTSTVLIESGALAEDPEKQALRGVTVTAILTALEAIATGRYEGADPDRYESLPFNFRVANDYLVLGGTVVLGTGAVVPLDLALAYDDPVAQRDLRLGEVGDLEGVGAMEVVDARGLYVHPVAPESADPVAPRLVRGARVAIVLRRGADPESAVVRRIP